MGNKVSELSLRGTRRSRRAVRLVAALGVPAVFAVVGSTGAWAQDPAHRIDADAMQLTAQKSLNSYLLPGYERMMQQSDILHSSINALCESPSDKALARARQDFQSLVTATERMAFVQFGPIREDNASDRLLFWPDRSGIGLKQVQRVLIEEDPSVLTTASLRDKSVALQGMTSLEYTLFGTSSTENLLQADSFACAYASVNSDLIHDLATTVFKAWSLLEVNPDSEGVSIATQWLAPNQAYPAYRSETEVLAELVSFLANGMATMRDTRILAFWDETPIRRNPNKALYRRAEMTMPALRANVEGFNQLFEVAAFDALLPEDERWIVRAIQLEMDNLRRALATLDTPTRQSFANALTQDRWTYVLILTRNLQRLFGQQMASKLGFAVSFSPSDGD